jgi:pimeloyl-ACP methyl ester carboxylesterase
MIWKTSRDSTRIPTKDGSLAVRVDGDPHKDPLLLCQRFRGTMDDWDPEFVARLSTARRVIRFDSLGIGESSGETPDTVRGILQGGQTSVNGPIKNETPKSGLGDQGPEWRFCDPIPDTETARYLRNAAVPRRFEGLRRLAGRDRTGWLGRQDSNLRIPNRVRRAKPSWADAE